MSESPVELARVRDDSCCRVEDTLQLVGRLSRSANQETAAIIWIGQLSCLTIFSTSLSVAAFLRRDGDSMLELEAMGEV